MDASQAFSILIVADGHRDQGLERDLLREAVAREGDRWFVHIANPERADLFASEGFDRVAEVIRVQGTLHKPLQPPKINGIIRQATELEHEEVYALDRLVVPGRDRTPLLRAAVKKGSFVIHREADDKPVDGFIYQSDDPVIKVLRPIVAPSEDIAAALLAHSLGVGDEPMTPTFAAQDGSVIKMLLQAGCELAPSSWVMHKNAPAQVDNSKIREFVPIM